MIETEATAVKQSSHPVTFSSKAFAAQTATSDLGPLTIQRRTPRAEDVQIDIMYCGAPGHEIVGRVVKVGSAVRRFKEGDIAAVGCMVDSCRKCASCGFCMGCVDRPAGAQSETRRVPAS